MSKNKIKKILIAIASLVLPGISFAGTVELFGVTLCQNDPCQLSDVVPAIGAFIQYLAGLAVVIAIIAVAYSGLKMIMSAGNSGEISTAKKHIYNALWGVFVALAAYLVIRAIVVGLGGAGTVLEVLEP